MKVYILVTFPLCTGVTLVVKGILEGFLFDLSRCSVTDREFLDRMSAYRLEVGGEQVVFSRAKSH